MPNVLACKRIADIGKIICGLGGNEIEGKITICAQNDLLHIALIVTFFVKYDAVVIDFDGTFAKCFALGEKACEHDAVCVVVCVHDGKAGVLKIVDKILQIHLLARECADVAVKALVGMSKAPLPFHVEKFHEALYLREIRCAHNLFNEENAVDFFNPVIFTMDASVSAPFMIAMKTDMSVLPFIRTILSFARTSWKIPSFWGRGGGFAPLTNGML